MTLIPADTLLQVTEFNLSILDDAKTFLVKELPVKGNRIPDKYRTLILQQGVMVMLEQIKIADIGGKKMQPAAIVVRIE